MLTSPYQQTSNQPISVYGQPLGVPEFDGEDYDKKQKRAYTAFLRSRPANYLPTLEALRPQGWDIPRLFETDRFIVTEPWDASLPDVAAPLKGSIAFRYDKPLEVTTYDEYYQKTGTQPVTCPSGSIPIASQVNLRLSPEQANNMPDGFKYAQRAPRSDEYPDGAFLYCVPKTFLDKIVPYTLMLSRKPLARTVERYMFPLCAYNTSLYLSVVRESPFTTRYRDTAPIALWAQYNSNFDRAITNLIDLWGNQGWVPMRGQYALSTGEDLAYKHDLYDDKLPAPPIN